MTQSKLRMKIESELKEELIELITKGEKKEAEEEMEEPRFTPEGVDYFGVVLPRLDERVPIEKAEEAIKKTNWWSGYRKNARTLAACLKANTPVYLEGPAGTGKTFFAEQMSAVMGLPFYRMVGSKYRMADSLFLEKDIRSTEKGPVTVFTPTPLLLGMIEGGVVLIDEANIIKADTLAELNLCDRIPIKLTDLVGQLIEMPNGELVKFPEDFQAHPNFRLILAGNFGRQYHGTKEQNYATLTRFHFIQFTRIPIEKQEEILENRLFNKLGQDIPLREIKRYKDLMQPILKLSEVIVKKIEEAEEKIDEHPEMGIYLDMPEITIRELIRYQYLILQGLKPEEVIEDYFLKLRHTHPEAAQIIEETFKQYFTPKK